MYPVSKDFEDRIKLTERTVDLKVDIQHSQGILYLTGNELVDNTFQYTESSQSGEEFTIGSTVASDISFTIHNNENYKDIKFIDSIIRSNFGLLVEESKGSHFLMPTQPSIMKGFEDKWEYVPLGVFNIDDVNIQRNSIQIKAVDNMLKLDIPYSLSKLSYPATLYQIFTNICNVGDVKVGTVSFPNMHYRVQKRPDDELTLREVLGYVAELAGCFAKFDRNGALELRWYKDIHLTLDPSNRFNFKPSDDIVKIKGIMATTEEATYLAGTDEYAIDLTDNPLLQDSYETVLRNIYNNVKDTEFTPFESDWQGNPALESGDIITQIDRDGKPYKTLVTKSTYKYRGKSKLEAKGLPEISKGYKGQGNRQMANIVRKVEEQLGDTLTHFEEQQLWSSELIANMLGGYAIKTDEAMYIADNKDLSKAKKVWKWGLGGFGYSENGVAGPYSAAITADGSIVAMLIAANIITANNVKTGVLESSNGSTWLDLDNGLFNFNGGLVTMNKDGVKVNHYGSNEYSQLRADGFYRKYKHGEGAYLNDIYVFTNVATDIEYDNPIKVRVNLPSRFRERTRVEVLPILKQFGTPPLT